MINQSELRMGNYVLYDHKTAWYFDIVTQIFDDSVEILSDSAFGVTTSKMFETSVRTKIIIR